MTGTSFLSLTLSHFRSYTRAEIDTGGRSVALHGPNGAGKTNVLEAVSMLSPGRGLRRAGAEDISRKAGIAWMESYGFPTGAGSRPRIGNLRARRWNRAPPASMRKRHLRLP